MRGESGMKGPPWSCRTNVMYVFWISVRFSCGQFSSIYHVFVFSRQNVHGLMLIVVKDFSVKPRHAIAPRAAFVASAILISGMKPPVAAENLEQEPPDTNPLQPLHHHLLFYTQGGFCCGLTTPLTPSYCLCQVPSIVRIKEVSLVSIRGGPTNNNTL